MLRDLYPKAWTIVEKASNSPFEQLEFSLPEILTNLDQTLIFLVELLTIFHTQGVLMP